MSGYIDPQHLVSSQVGRSLPFAAVTAGTGLLGPECPERPMVEDYIAKRFASQYAAEIVHFLPWLLTVNQNGNLAAAVGLRPAEHEALFLEQYLDEPVERVLQNAFECPVARGDIIEIGNLVATRGGSSYFLFAAMTMLLKAAGYKWLIFTANPHVKKITERMGFRSMELCEAERARLGQNTGTWGSYYDDKPKVFAGDLDCAATILYDSPTLLSVLTPHREHLLAGAHQLRRNRQEAQ